MRYFLTDKSLGEAVEHKMNYWMPKAAWTGLATLLAANRFLSIARSGNSFTVAKHSDAALSSATLHDMAYGN